MSLKNERAKSVEQTESALKEQGESFRAERQALEAEVARGRSEVQKLQVRAFHYRRLRADPTLGCENGSIFLRFCFLKITF